MKHATFNQFGSSGVENLPANWNDGNKYSRKFNPKGSVRDNKNNEEWSKYLQYKILNRMESLINNPINHSAVPETGQTVTVIKDNESNQNPQKVIDMDAQTQQLSPLIASNSKINTRYNTQNIEVNDPVESEKNEKQQQEVDIKELKQEKRNSEPREITYRGLESNNPWLKVLTTPTRNVAKQPPQKNEGLLSRNKLTASTGHNSRKSGHNKVALTKIQNTRTRKSKYNVQQNEILGSSNTTDQSINQVSGNLTTIASMNAEIAKLENELIANFTHKLSEYISSIIRNTTNYEDRKTVEANESKHNRRKQQKETTHEDLKRHGQRNQVANPRKVNLEVKGLDMKKKLQPHHSINSSDTINQRAGVQRKKMPVLNKPKATNKPRKNVHVALKKKFQTHRRIESIAKQLPQNNRDVGLRNKSSKNNKDSFPITDTHKYEQTATHNNRAQKVNDRTDNDIQQHVVDIATEENVHSSDRRNQGTDEVRNDIPTASTVGTEYANPEENLIINYTNRLDKLISTLVQSGDKYRIRKSEKIHKSKYNIDAVDLEDTEELNEKNNTEESPNVPHTSEISTLQLNSKTNVLNRKEKLRQPENVAKEIPQNHEDTVSRQKSRQGANIVNERDSNETLAVSSFAKQSASNSINDTSTNKLNLVHEKDIEQRRHLSHKSPKKVTHKAESINTRSRETSKADSGVNRKFQDAVNDIAKANVSSSGTISRKKNKVKNNLEANITANNGITTSEERFINNVTHRLKQFISTFISKNKHRNKKRNKENNKTKANRHEHQHQNSNAKILNEKYGQKFQEVTNEGLQLNSQETISGPKDMKKQLLKSRYEINGVVKSPSQENLSSPARHKLRHNINISSKTEKGKVGLTKIKNNTATVTTKDIMNIVEEAINDMAQNSANSGHGTSQVNSTGKTEFAKSEEQFVRNVANGLKQLILTLIETKDKNQMQEKAVYRSGFDDAKQQNNEMLKVKQSRRKALKPTPVYLQDTVHVNLKKSDPKVKKKLQLTAYNSENLFPDPDIPDTNIRFKRQEESTDEPQYTQSQELLRIDLLANQTVEAPVSAWIEQSDISTRLDPLRKNAKYSYVVENPFVWSVYSKNKTEDPFRQHILNRNIHHRFTTTGELKDLSSNRRGLSVAPIEKQGSTYPNKKYSQTQRNSKLQQLKFINLMPVKERSDREKDLKRYSNIIRQWIKRNKFNETTYLKYIIQTPIIDSDSIDEEITSANERKKRMASYYLNKKQNIKISPIRKQQRREISKTSNKMSKIQRNLRQTVGYKNRKLNYFPFRIQRRIGSRYLRKRQTPYKRKMIRQMFKIKRLKYRKRRSKAKGVHHLPRNSFIRFKGRVRSKKFGTVTNEYERTQHNPNTQQSKLIVPSNAGKLHKPKRYISRRSIDQVISNSISNGKDKRINGNLGKVESLSSKDRKKMTKTSFRRTRELKQEVKNSSNKKDWKPLYDVQSKKYKKKLNVRKSKAKQKPIKKKTLRPSKTKGGSKEKDEIVQRILTTKNEKAERKKTASSKQVGKKNVRKGNKEEKNLSSKSVKKNVVKDKKKKVKSKQVSQRKSSVLKEKGSTVAPASKSIEKGVEKRGKKKNVIKKGLRSKSLRVKETYPNKGETTAIGKEIKESRVETKKKKVGEKRKKAKLKTKSTVAQLRLKEKAKIGSKVDNKLPKITNASKEKKTETSVSNGSLIESNEKQNLTNTLLDNLKFPYTNSKLIDKSNGTIKSNIDETKPTDQSLQNLPSKTYDEKEQAPILSSIVNASKELQTANAEINAALKNFSTNIINRTGNTAEINKTIGNDTSFGSITETNKTIAYDTNIGNFTVRNVITGNNTNIGNITGTTKTIENDVGVSNITEINITTRNDTNISNAINSGTTLAKENASSLMNDSEVAKDIGQANNATYNASKIGTAPVYNISVAPQSDSTYNSTRNESSEIALQQPKINNATNETVISSGVISQVSDIVNNGTNSTLKIETRLKGQLTGGLNKSSELNLTVNGNGSFINDTVDLSIKDGNDELYREENSVANTTQDNMGNTFRPELIDPNEYIKQLKLVSFFFCNIILRFFI